MKKRNICIITLLITLIVGSQSILVGCKTSINNNSSSPTESTVDLSEVNTDILKLANNEATINNSIVCTYNEFNNFNIPNDVYDKIATSKYISEVKKSIGLPVLRKNGEVYYSVHPIKTESNKKLYGFIMYNNQGKLIDGWCTDTLHNKNDFTKLYIGNRIEKATNIDPYCCFMENLNENTATSYHKLKGGKIYVIDYQRTDKNNNYYIKNMHYNNDPCNFTNCILMQDLELISSN